MSGCPYRFFNPYCDELRQELLNITKAHKLCRFTTPPFMAVCKDRAVQPAQKSSVIDRDGVDVLGMTGNARSRFG